MTLEYLLIIYFSLGTTFGWWVHSCLLALAYRMGIVEYKGRKQGPNHD
ncbi:hypothetical protein [Acidovorax sp.]|nr:hypothetical protein [Acidovorax sp.]MBL7089934.1 hypothetical protein [Acidovorax sp.]